MGLARQPELRVHAEMRPPDLDRFEGCWVAVKDGKVLAAADTSRALAYEVRKLADRGRGAIAQYVPPEATSLTVGAG
jgi:hypothetical protein